MAVKTAAKPKPTAPTPPADEEDIVEAQTEPDGQTEPDAPTTDEPVEDNEELDLLAEVPWFGMIAPENVATGDGRKFAEGALTWRDLPRPLQYVPMTGDGGHSGAAVVGRIDQMVKDDAGRVWGAGAFIPQLPYAGEALDMVLTGASPGVSVDTDMIRVQMDEDFDPMAVMSGESELVFAEARIAGLTMVSIPAFAEAFIQLGSADDMQAAIAAANGGDDTMEPIAASAAFEDCGCELAISEEPFSFKRADYTDAQWAAATIGWSIEQEPIWPILTPSGELSRAAVHQWSERFDELSDGLVDSQVEFARAALDAALVDLGEMDDPDTFAISEAAWDGSASRFDDQQWQRSCILDKGEQAGTAKQRYALPIREPNGDLSRAAVHAAAGRLDQVDAPDAAKAKAKGSLRAAYKELGEDAPDAITAAATAVFAPGTHDGPGWITHPRDTERLRRYWVRGKGAAKIRWGQPGDFNRCRKQLGKYVEPRFLAGTCANLHKEAIKLWPGQEDGGRKGNRGHHAAETLVASAMFNFVSGEGELPPMSFFQNPELERITQLTVEDNGHVYGHLAEWGTCHIGIPGACVTPPNSYSDYAYFHTGRIQTDGGEVAVGHLTMGIGHASLASDVTAAMATAHYDRDDATIADVVMGEDAHGIWFSGMIRPGVTEERVAQFKANGSLSGDWRYLHGALELIGAVAVNTPGYPIPRTELAASAGVQTALVAAGIVYQPEEREAERGREMTPAEIAAISRAAVEDFIAQSETRKRVAALRARNAELRTSQRNQRVLALRSRVNREGA